MAEQELEGPNTRLFHESLHQYDRDALGRTINPDHSKKLSLTASDASPSRSQLVIDSGVKGHLAYDIHAHDNARIIVGDSYNEIRQYYGARPSSAASTSAWSLTRSEKDVTSYFECQRTVPLDEPLPGTCGWLLETQEYQDWRADVHSSILWLTGYAGAGKSILTRFLVEDLQQTMTASSTNINAQCIILYFCCDRRQGQTNDVRTLLKRFISEFLNVSRSLIKHVKTTYHFLRSEFEASYNKLWNVFQSVVQKAEYTHYYIVIDGLDECEQLSSMKLLISLIRLTRGWGMTTMGGAKTFKFVISGQPHLKGLPLQVQGYCSEYHVALETRPGGFVKDMQKFINKEISVMEDLSYFSEELGRTLRTRLFELAENSFLWLKVVLDHLKESNLHWPETVQALLRNVPADLREVYTRYLPLLPSDHAGVQQQYLQLLLSCTRPLRLQEIEMLRSAGCRQSFSTERCEDVKITAKSLRSALGPTIVIAKDDKVYFVHSTVRDFLLDSSLSSHPILDSSHLSDGPRHLFLACCCIKYLTHQDFHVDLHDLVEDSPISIQDATTLDADTSDLFGDLFNAQAEVQDDRFINFDANTCLQVSHRFPAYDYAARYWIEHCAKSENLVPDRILEHVLALLTFSSPVSTNWYAYMLHSTNLKLPDSSSINSLVVASFFGLSRIVSLLLQHNTVSADQLQESLFWAASRGHENVAQLLLRHGVTASGIDLRKSPLHAAVNGGFDRICLLLLKDGQADPNLQDSFTNSPLILAAQQNYKEVISVLLSHPEIEINRTDRSGATAFTEAIRWGSLDALSLLVAYDQTAAGSVDRDQRSLLIHAAREGNEAVVKEILPFSKALINHADKYGRTAISYAAQRANLNIVKSLSRQQADISAVDQEGRNAISWAAGNPMASERKDDKGVSVLDYLVQRCPVGADVEDINGWTPLAWTLVSPGCLESVRILFFKGKAVIDRRDGSCRKSLLSWAASLGLIDIVHFFLVDCHANLHLRDTQGFTTLFYAARAGWMEIVSLLIEHGAHHDAQDSNGRTASYWARLNGHINIAEFLDQIDRNRSIS